jgi:hypothetical protein
MTNTQWQLFVTVAIVIGAACYFGRSLWISAHPKKGACGGCGCKTSSAAKEPQEQLISSESIGLRPARRASEHRSN